ncbi:MAG: ribosome maturation factor RimM [gamma proteobacterium symbiont of Taylorina sp.]|nr:ribosome maturation factor RimM [gamma proteobacterium symbiont of Taylorina sp.]
MSDELYVLGKITGFYGVKGWLKLYSYTDPKENIVQYSSLKIKLGKQWQSINLDTGKTHGKGVVAHFSGYDNREIAAVLIGSELAINRSNFKASAKDEYFWADLIDLKVINLQGVILGSVSRLMETSANDVLVIKDIESEAKLADEILIPFVLNHYIERVDLNSGIITVDWPVDWNE